jgi:hypothetical protein
MEPEVSADLPPEDRAAMSAFLDILLTDGLSQQKGIVLVDRQALDKVLAEKVAGAAGAAKLSAEEVAAPLRPFWAAGVLICPVVTTLKPVKPGDPVRLVVTIEAVAAQTGQSLAEIEVVGLWKNGQWSEPPQFAEPLKGFWKMLSRNAQASRHQRLVEIPDGRLVSRLTRLQWLVDGLGDSLRASVAAQPGLTLLTPRRPASTKEERLLRVMGLASTNPGDPVAGLACAPDVRVRLELSEEIGQHLEYEKTPIVIKLSLLANGREVTEQTFRGLAAGYSALREQAVAWLAPQLHLQADPAAPAGDEAYCRALAQEELAAARQMEKLCADYDSPMCNPSLPRSVFFRALRAAHLDPTSEEAARMVVLSLEAEYAARGLSRSRVCDDRVIEEGLRYLARFSKAPRAEAVRNKVAGVAFGSLTELRYGGLWLDKPFNPEIYRYAKASLVNVEDEVRRSLDNNIWVASNVVCEAIFVHCPADRLEDEHAYWRDFWQKKIQPLPGDMPPWEFVEIGYHVRKQDWKALRQNLTALAARYPKTSRNIWWGTEPWPAGESGGKAGQPCWKVRLSVFLKPCGDPEWQTWEPVFTTTVYGWEPKAYDRFLNRHNPPMPTAFDAAAAVPLPADRVTLAWDDPQDAKLAREKGPQPMLIASGFIWLALPGPDASHWHDTRLFVVPLASLLKPANELQVRPVRIAWPADVAGAADAPAEQVVRCWAGSQEGGAAVVWVGTLRHGLARFELQAGDRWQGRWYTAADGLPGEEVFHVAPGLYDGRPRLLAMGQPRRATPNVSPGDKFLYALDPTNGQLAMLASSPRWSTWQLYRWPAYRMLVATWNDGRKVPLCLYNRDDFPTLDAKAITKVEHEVCTWATTQDEYEGESFQVTRDGAALRLWWAGPRGILELDDHLRPLPGRVNLLPIKDRSLYRSPGSPVDGLYLNSHEGTPLWTVLQAPPFDVMCCTSAPPTFWCVDARAYDAMVGRARQVVAYRPATQTPSEENDCWLGPWQVPDRSAARGMVFLGGRLWLTTSRGDLYRVDPDLALRAADSAHAQRSTAQWRRGYYARLADASWPTPARMYLSLGDWNRALAAIDARRQALGASTRSLNEGGDEAVDLALWEALIRARKGDFEQAERLYLQLLDAGKVEPCAKGEALANLINVRHAAGQWRTLQEAAERFQRQFGDETAPFGNSRRLQWFVNDAQKHLAAEKPSSSAPAAAAVEKVEKQ